MESFDNNEIKKILSLWKGNVNFYKKDGKITKIELSKRYNLDFLKDNVQENSETETTKEKTGVIFAIEKVVNGYGFLKVEGDQNGITVIATVKPQSLQDFKFYCMKLNKIESKII